MQTALEDLDKEALIALVKQQGQVLLKRDQALLQREEEIANHHKEIAERTEEITSLTQERDYLKAQVEMLRRMQFGQKRERFEGDPSQMALPFEVLPAQEEQQQEEIKEKVEYIRKRPNHHGRAALPAHLPVEEIEIYPEGDLSEMVCIGKEYPPDKLQIS